MGDETKHDEHLCRICFNPEAAEGEEGRLVRPCNCSGSSAYVHEGCLRQWQRSVQLSTSSNHPTNVAREERHLICSVCKHAFDIPPQSRAELMADLAGVQPEELKPGFLLVSARREEPESTPAEGLPFLLQVVCELKHRHFRNAVYMLMQEMTEHRGRGNNVSDAILGVNLVRRMEGDESAIFEALLGFSEEEQRQIRIDGVRVEIFNGGPVNTKMLTAMCVITGSKALPDGVRTVLEVASSDVEAECSRLVVGQVAPVLALARAEAMMAGKGSTGWPLAQVACFAGYALWSRTQLLGELARGSWRWRQGTVADVLPLLGHPEAGGWVAAEQLFDACTSPSAAPPLRSVAPNELSQQFARSAPQAQVRNVPAETERAAPQAAPIRRWTGAVASLVRRRLQDS